MKQVENLKICDLVESLTGSDSGVIYLLVGFDAKSYALLVDGKRHKLEQPKHKNKKQLKYAGAIDEIPETDAAVVTAIRRNIIPQN